MTVTIICPKLGLVNMRIQSEKIVLSICDIHPLRLGSFEEYLIELSRQLSLKGFKHVIVFRKDPIHSVLELLLSYNVDIRIFTPSKHSILNFVVLYRLIRDINPSIVHFHFYPPFSVLNFIKVFTDAKFIYTDHMGIRRTKNRSHKLLRMYYHYLNFVLFSHHVDSIICVSNFVKLKYVDEYGIKSNKLTVIYNGINCNRFSHNIDSSIIRAKYNVGGEFVVSCIAGLRESKGVQCLIRAAPSILKTVPNVKFFIIGDGEYREFLENYVSELNIKDKFTFTGFIDSTEDFYLISSCVVVPSLVDEAFCFVAAEALVAGCSVVAFDSGAIKEVFGMIKSVTIIPKDSDFLSRHVIDILLNPQTDCIIDESVCVIENNYSIEECVKQYMVTYFN